MLKLTNLTEKGDTIYISVLHIVSLREYKSSITDDTGTCISTSNESYYVKESVADVMKMIDEAGF